MMSGSDTSRMVLPPRRNGERAIWVTPDEERWQTQELALEVCPNAKPQVRQHGVILSALATKQNLRCLIHKIIWAESVKKAGLNTASRAVKALDSTLTLAIGTYFGVIERIVPRRVAHIARGSSFASTLGTRLDVRASVGSLPLRLRPGHEPDAAANPQHDGRRGHDCALV